MATLTEVSFYTRRMIVGLVLFFVFILLSPFLWMGVKNVYLAVFPPEPDEVTGPKLYGQLPVLVFPRAAVDYRPEYKLETKEGGLPQLPKVGRAYLVEINRNRLLELDRMRNRAKGLEFTSEPRGVDDRTYIFTDSNLPREMAVDLIYGSYGYKYKWLGDEAFLSAKAVPGKDEAQAGAKSFFQGLGLLEAELTSGTTTYTFLSGKPDGQMVPVGSLSEANFVRVDLFRADIDKQKVVTTDWDTSSVNVIFSGQTDKLKRIVGANYNFSRIDAGGYGTYVLKSVDQAWAELRAGNGYVAKTKGDKVATIRKVTVAYFESNQPQKFLQPVFVFEGDNSFVAYVAAIDPNYPVRPKRN